jgi:DNA modification methylase
LLLSQHSSARHPLLTTTITSPPYGDLKDYGHPAQFGRGQPHDEYLVELRRVFRSLFSHTRQDGALWLVVDTLRAKAPAGQPWRLRMLPFELAQEAETEGWILRDIIVWRKDKTLPWSSHGRLRNEFEYILFFVRSAKYKYHVDRLREPLVLEEWWVRYPERYNPLGKAPSNVWFVPIPVQGSWANTKIQHACPLPPDLVERMLLLSSDEGDVVFDPFAGSGVVLAEAERLERRPVGMELVAENVAAFEAVVRPEILQRRGTDELAARLESSERLRELLLKLRILKYPRALIKQGETSCPDVFPTAAIVTSPSRRLRDGRVRATVRFFVDGDENARLRYERAAHAASSHRPASKFGIEADIFVHHSDALPTFMRGRRLHAYIGGRMHDAAGVCRFRDVSTYAARTTRVKFPVVLSPIEVHEAPRALRG